MCVFIDTQFCKGKSSGGGVSEVDIFMVTHPRIDQE